ncbi:unnamed protein product [Brassicogethes aeneus]|uniref:Zinc finger bed domain-containing protein 1-like n=1 Tax=Brassicogethes aeneus TaxID=1431903 RepID=A0A9P0FQ40_BRAAE|nr:unnamed protein product [Brassicogethes aeneus]
MVRRISLDGEYYDGDSESEKRCKILEKEKGDMREKLTKHETESHNLLEDIIKVYRATGGATYETKELLIVITTPSPLLETSIETKLNRHTAQYIAEEMGKIIEKYGPNQFLGFVSDNAKNMQLAGKILNEKYDIIQYGCLSHGLNLLCNDLLKIKSISAVIDKVIDIVKEIKRKQVLYELLRIKQTENKNVEQKAGAIQLPVKTRWSSILVCLKSVYNTKLSLQGVSQEATQIIDKHVKQWILDEEVFWSQISNLINFFQPIGKWLKIVEGDYCTIQFAVNAFHDIKKVIQENISLSPLNDEEKKKLLEFVDKREHFVMKPIHYAAELLNPKSQGSELDETQILSAIECILNIAKSKMNIKEQEIIDEIADYRRRSGKLFGNHFIWKSSFDNPVSWWKGLCSSSLLSKVATRILMMPASSAATERSFIVTFIKKKKEQAY